MLDIKEEKTDVLEEEKVEDIFPEEVEAEEKPVDQGHPHCEWQKDDGEVVNVKREAWNVKRL